jgi:zinc protease
MEDVKAFVDAWYTPANATLVVTGAFDPKSTLALADTYFGSLPSLPPPRHTTSRTEWRVRDVRLDVSASVARDFVLFSFLAPPIGTKEDLALDAVRNILAGNGERFEHALVRTGLSDWFEVRESSYRRASLFSLMVNVVPGQDPEAVIAAIERVIDELGTQVTPAEADRARRVLRDEQLRRLETSATRGWNVVRSAPQGHFDVDRYDTIDARAIMAAVREWLTPSRRAVAVIHKDPRAPFYGKLTSRQEKSP